jgi:hypothetical protein
LDIDAVHVRTAIADIAGAEHRSIRQGRSHGGTGWRIRAV